MVKHEVYPIRNFLDSLEVRKIRNQCRIFMTNNRSEISIIKQLSWYLKIYRKANMSGNMTCFLFKVDNFNSGFGLIRIVNDRYWITGGLKSNQRGKGFGKILFKDLLEKIPSNEVWLEVLDTNGVAKNLYQKIGFKNVKINDANGNKIIIMKLNKKK